MTKKRIIIVGMLCALLIPAAECFAANTKTAREAFEEASRSIQPEVERLARSVKIDYSRLRPKWKSYSDADLRRMSIFLTQEELYMPDKWSWYRTIYEGTKDGLESVGIAIDDFVDEVQINSLLSPNDAKERSIRDDLMYGHNMVKNLRETELEERLEERLEYKELYNAFHDIGQILFFVIILGIFVGIPLLIKARSKRKKVKKLSRRQKAKITNSKIEIVNNKKYTTLKKLDRIKYLQDLKKQTSANLSKVRKELSVEQNKLKDMPADVAKYVKPVDTSGLKKSIARMEDELLAIEDLIRSETGKSQKKAQKKKTTYIEDED